GNPGPFTVMANPTGTPAALAKRTFRIGFPTQNLSGTYSLTLASSIKDVNGNALDTNLNAGLDSLRGFSVPPSVGPAITYTTSPNKQIVSGPQTFDLTIKDQFIIQQDAANHIQLQLNISGGIFDPGVIAKLIAPNGKVIPLFTNVGKVGTPPH